MKVNERPVEYAFVLGHMARIYPGSVLDVGSGESAWSQMLAYCCFEVTDIDNSPGFRLKRIGTQKGKKYKLKQSITVDVTKIDLVAQFDFVCCISTLEHIKDFELAISKMFAALNPGGHLALTIPYHFIDSFWNVYDVTKPEKVAGLCHQFNQRQIDKWLLEHDATLIDEKYYKIFSGQYWRAGDRLQPVEVHKSRAQLACLLMSKAAV